MPRPAAYVQRDFSRELPPELYPTDLAPFIRLVNGTRAAEPGRFGLLPPWRREVKYGRNNARRDNLEGFWKDLFGFSHGIVVANAFYENVNRHRAEGRDLAPGEMVENLVLEFKPRPTQDMLVACLWSRWAPGEPDLLSFAAITDEPPEEVAAAGHDRCIIPIRPENIDTWLNPDRKSLAAMYAILDDRERPYYEHRMAA
jgi:putative SOS response-associated peptidase YedK